MIETDPAAPLAERLLVLHTELGALLTERGVPFVDWEGWARIDARERALGAAEGRERVKISALDDLLDASR